MCCLSRLFKFQSQDGHKQAVGDVLLQATDAGQQDESYDDTASSLASLKLSEDLVVRPVFLLLCMFNA